MARKNNSIDPLFDEKPAPKWGRFAILFILLGVIAFLIYGAFVGGRGEAGPVPIIRADETPWTRLPEEPGGMEIPNQDSTVFELMRDQELLESEQPKEEKKPEPKPEPEPEQEEKSDVQQDTTIESLIEETIEPQNSAVTLRLGAVRGSDTSVAQSEFERLQGLSDGVLSNATAHFEPVNLPEQGDFVRINVTVQNEVEADQICAVLRSKNAPCLKLK